MSTSSLRNLFDDFFNANEALTKFSIQCIQNNDKITLRQLLERCVEMQIPLTAENEYGGYYAEWTALHEAASKPEYKECLELLLEYSGSIIDFYDRTRYGDNALHIACKYGCEENVLMLLEKGCNPLKLDRFDGSAMTCAIEDAGNIKIVQYLLNHNSEDIDSLRWRGKMTPLCKAVQSDHIEICRMLVEKGANVSPVGNVDEHDDLPLHSACEKGNFDMVHFLLDNSSMASINRLNDSRMTPLMVALVYESDIQIIRLLLERGAKTDICGDRGNLALHSAVQSGNIELVQIILEHTDASSIEQWFANIPTLLQMHQEIIIESLTVMAICSQNVKCLEILTSSEKISKHILQTPLFCLFDDDIEVYSPLAYIFNWMNFEKQEPDAYLQVLLKHELTTCDEFFKKLEKWPLDNKRIAIQNPFSKLFLKCSRLSKPYDYYFHLLNEHNVTIDYCLQCYHDNTQPFATFTAYEKYQKYYKPVLDVIHDGELEALKLILSQSAILEPDVLFSLYIDHYAKTNYKLSLIEILVEGARNMWKYVISLKPIYYRHTQIWKNYSGNEPLWYPYSTVSEEFSESTLKQLCRTNIRHHIRGYTLDDNLRNFRRNIMELPLPSSLKDYLLFKH